MSKASHPPSINETAFECPFCGAYTTQSWHDGHAEPVRTESRTPNISDAETRAEIVNDRTIPEEARKSLVEWVDQLMTGDIIFDKTSKNIDYTAHNVHLSKCFNCKKVALWINGALVFPPQRAGVAPNADLPAEVVRDFEEARSIVELSPRGASALMRLAVQKLCVELGGRGKSIDEVIASLVANGLNPQVQKALDIVRVIGNESVHPGTLDMKDNRDTALRLFGLVNAIADQMISHPKSVDALYEQLPPEKRAAIEARNAKATGKGK